MKRVIFAWGVFYISLNFLTYNYPIGEPIAMNDLIRASYYQLSMLIYILILLKITSNDKHLVPKKIKA